MAEQACRVWIHGGGGHRILRWWINAVERPAAVNNGSGHRPGGRIDADHPHHRLVYENTGGRATESGSQVRGHFHVRQLVSFDGSSDRLVDESWNESAMERSAWSSRHVSVHGA